MFEDRGFKLIIGTLAALGIAFLAFPVLVTVVASFEKSSFIAFPPTGWSLRWYGEIGSINRIVEATLTSLQVAIASAALATTLAGLAALALVRGKVPLGGAIATVLASPISLPMIAIGMALVQFFIAIGVAFTWWSLVVGHMVLVIAYPLRTIISSLLLAERSQEEAAASLGATPVTVFRTVTLAQIAPGVVSGFLFAFLISFDNYPISLFLVRGSLTTMPIEVFNYINQSFDPTPAAFSTVYIVVLTILIAIAEKRYRIVSLALPR
ncbi:ABC transporter permease [Acuticoccus kandeliae]|uniref:ABC transporter permease n=1 Tax=Acuticoccus kandeliae TaxID=2073160 RepID=UPI000D3ED430|nr:ABC transporter permease [Acuticoccus kandeliae]